jgi:hypothetical protein
MSLDRHQLQQNYPEIFYLPFHPLLLPETLFTNSVSIVESSRGEILGVSIRS